MTGKYPPLEDCGHKDNTNNENYPIKNFVIVFVASRRPAFSRTKRGRFVQRLNKIEYHTTMNKGDWVTRLINEL
jgi:hypothetical protein